MQLTVTTSSTKRRRVAESRKPGTTLPGSSSVASQQARHAGRRHGSDLHHHQYSPSSTLPSNSDANWSRSSSASLSPRYVPAHLQDEVLGTRPKPRSPTPESNSSVESSSAAYAGLSLSSDPGPGMSGAENERPSSSTVNRTEAIASEQDVDMDLGPSQNEDTIKADGTAQTSSTSASNEKSSQFHESRPSHDLPSIDDQVAHVTRYMMLPLQEKQKGYLVSSSWLTRVLSRSSTHGDKVDKTAAEGEIGPVDNSDLILDTDPSASFKDEGGQPFVPLRPGLQIGEDYEIVPEEGWDLIMKWYGLAKQSTAIVRYAHNTNVGGQAENIQYEVNPPIFTILKLSNPASGVTPQTLKDKNAQPVKVLASRHTNFQKWLKEAKELANIDISTKVRVWRILGGLGSAVATPAASRNPSPAPAASMVASAGNSLVLDPNTFLSLSEGPQRELLEEAKDQTANPNYNGRMTLELAGLGGSDVIVLEERTGDGQWVSDASKQTLNRLGVPAGNVKNGVSGKLKSKSPTASGRSSPVMEPMRGRRKDGKPRGCTGLSNLGNTCYMNSALQCVRSVEELSYYFLNNVYKRDLNPSNPLSHNGDVAKAYANLLHMIYDEAGQSSFSPRQLKQTVGRYGSAFSGYGQQDSQEFLLFLLDGLQEDLNRIQKKPYIEKPDSTDEMVHDKKALAEFADRCWDIYKARNDSVITDLFAGMYKSTLVCPVCEKVSIIFDPFNNLTLQIPIENIWSKEIFYFPLHEKPVIVSVEIDKNASIKSLKEMVAKKMGSDLQKLIMSEIYKCKFYRMFDNSSSIADCQIHANDEVAIFEVESVPTNYDSDKPKRNVSALTFSPAAEEIPSFDSPKADRMLVPIFHRVLHPKSSNKYTQRQLFGAPSYTIITREEAKDYDGILSKVLSEVDRLTTRDILNEGGLMRDNHDAGTEDSDTVIMNDDDAQSADSKIKTSSVEDEDGLVDVSMRDASDDVNAGSTPATHTGSVIPPSLRNLFEMKIIRSNEVVPTGWSAIEETKNYPSVSSRLKRKPVSDRKRNKTKKGRFTAARASPVSSEDELQSTTRVNVNEMKTSDDSDGDRSQSRRGSGSDSDSDMYSDVDQARPNGRDQKSMTRSEEPLVRPGEGILLDWTEEAHDALFGGDAKRNDSLRGTPTWVGVEHVPDPELSRRRALRVNKKKRGVSLNECLDEFNKEEILSENDAWYCPRCKEHRRASKKFELWKTPDILVMHLKRFSASRGFRDKIDVLVDFPVEGLDLSGRVEAPEEGKSLIYDLFAVDNHYGGLGGGHYTAYAKNFITNDWYEYNDSLVSKVTDPQSVVTSAAYLLFYRRRSEHPLGGRILQEITESSTRAMTDSGDSQDESQGGSSASAPSGEGRRLGGFSRNGSSSALTGVGAAHQAGDGGLRIGAQARTQGDNDEELPPAYSHHPSSGERSLVKADRQEDDRSTSGILL